MKNKKLIRIILLITTLVFAAFIIQYYWDTNELQKIKTVPMYVMLFALGYIVTQIIKRVIIKSQNWWDWLYYVGLSSMMLPIFLGDEGNLSVFNTIADYGSFFFVIPALFDIKLMLNKSES